MLRRPGAVFGRQHTSAAVARCRPLPVELHRVLEPADRDHRASLSVRSRAYGSAMQRLRPLSEEECYLRCYGSRGADETVRVMQRAAPVAEAPSVFAERIRLLFEAALDGRERDAA